MLPCGRARAHAHQLTLAGSLQAALLGDTPVLSPAGGCRTWPPRPWRWLLGDTPVLSPALQDLASQAMEVVAGQRSLDTVVDAIKDHELAILATLADGSALAQVRQPEGVPAS